MLSRLLNWGGSPDPKSEALAAFLVASDTNRRAFFELLADALQGGEAARRALDLARDLWPEVLPQQPDTDSSAGTCGPEVRGA